MSKGIGKTHCSKLGRFSMAEGEYGHFRELGLVKGEIEWVGELVEQRSS